MFQASPAGSASSRMSSGDIKEFYYDDELNSPELAMEKHLKLQSTADFDSSENIMTTATAAGTKCHPCYLSGIYDSGGCSDGRPRINAKGSAALRQGIEMDLKSKGVTFFKENL